MLSKLKLAGIRNMCKEMKRITYRMRKSGRNHVSDRVYPEYIKNTYAQNKKTNNPNNNIGKIFLINISQNDIKWPINA